MKTKEQKRQQALARKELCDMMSPFQRLSRLDGIFGKECGAKKERFRLTRGICRYIANRHKDTNMVPVRVIVEKTEAEKELEAKVGQKTPLVVPKARVRHVIPTIGREADAR